MLGGIYESKVTFERDCRRNFRSYSLVLIIFSILATSADTFAASRQLIFEDPINDSFFTGTNIGDLIKLDFSFDSVTGDYFAIFTTNPEILFSGEIEVNLHLLNTNLIPNNITFHDEIPTDAYLVNNFNIVSQAVPTDTLSLSGNFTGLTTWEIGHAILPGSCAYMLQNGCVQTTIQGFLPGGDLYDGLDMDFGDEQLITGVTSVQSVPIPLLSSLLLFLFIGVYGTRRFQTFSFPPNQSPQSARAACPTT